MYNVIKLGATMGSAMVFFTVLIDNSKMLFTFGQLSSYRMKKQHKNVTYVFILLVNFQRNLVLAQNQIALRTQFPTKILG